MGIAASSLKLGFAYMVDGELMDWKLSIDASRSIEACFAKVDDWLAYYQPDLLVLEDEATSRKGPNALALIATMRRAAEEAGIAVVMVARPADAANKYAEATVLAAEFPQIAAWLPDKRRAWDVEPRNIILFEALALAWQWWQSADRIEEDTIDW